MVTTRMSLYTGPERPHDRATGCHSKLHEVAWTGTSESEVQCLCSWTAKVGRAAHQRLFNDLLTD